MQLQLHQQDSCGQDESRGMKINRNKRSNNENKFKR